MLNKTSRVCNENMRSNNPTDFLNIYKRKNSNFASKYVPINEFFSFE